MKVLHIACRDISSDPGHGGYAPPDIESLAASIRTFGVLRPILVRPVGLGYEVVHGERRLQAARIAGLAGIPAVVVDEAGAHAGLALAA